VVTVDLALGPAFQHDQVADRVTTAATTLEDDDGDLRPQAGVDSLGPVVEEMAKFAAALKDLDKSTWPPNGSTNIVALPSCQPSSRTNAQGWNSLPRDPAEPGSSSSPTTLPPRSCSTPAGSTTWSSR